MPWPLQRLSPPPSRARRPRSTRDSWSVRRLVDDIAVDPPPWRWIDRNVVDQAPYVPLFSWNVVDVLGKGVGNYQFSGRGMGLLIDQLWVR